MGKLPGQVNLLLGHSAQGRKGYTRRQAPLGKAHFSYLWLIASVLGPPLGNLHSNCRTHTRDPAPTWYLCTSCL